MDKRYGSDNQIKQTAVFAPLKPTRVPTVGSTPVKRSLFPSRDSAVGRAIATGLQVLAGLGTSLPILQLILNDPNFTILVTRYYPTLVPTIAVLTAIVTLISNVMRKEVPNV